MSIDDLCTKPNVALPVNKRYPQTTVDAYEADLRRAVYLFTEGGQVLPAHAALSRHFKKTLGIVVARNTIAAHLERLQKGEELWPA